MQSMIGVSERNDYCAGRTRVGVGIQCFCQSLQELGDEVVAPKEDANARGRFVPASGTLVLGDMNTERYKNLTKVPNRRYATSK
jgi:hypothetical protein